MSQKTLRYASLHGDNLRGGHHSSETISMVCTVHPTAESISAVGNTPQRQTQNLHLFLAAFKGTILRKTFDL